ncbi:MAG: ImmA/IrrE family metallo-endopeptidase [Clostridia bacterium]|nr:ImmA/IrrE family metallo-endopeptidase [Clostridia bacterium]
MYSNYKTARDNAWRYLIRHKVKELPVDVFALSRKDKITLVPYSAEEGKEMAEIIGAAYLMPWTDGFAVQIRGDFLIFWDDSMPLPRQRFTIAHELGHIYNGDIGIAPTLRNKEPSEKDDPKETAANIFAARILAPACVLWALGVQNPETIAELCAISGEAAKWRWERLKVLYEREKIFMEKYGKTCFLMSPLEQKVFKQFKKYIRSR